ncbi:MAG: glycine dehydrogenase subunit 2 [Proteobacteria bacterium]|nr:glycine dehydrogenase subunit 2 [Pseudomonadota bacterium]
MSTKGHSGVMLPELEVETVDISTHLPSDLIRKDIEGFPELSEPEVVRHYTRLSSMNYSLDAGFYPLGSCTMKYNPKLNESVAGLDGFCNAHPYQNEEDSQGILELMWALERDLAEISGMDVVSLHPAAGSHGEFLGLKLIRAYHEDRGDDKRKIVLIPDSAHGTNPSSAAVCGYRCTTLPSRETGLVDLDKLKELMTDEVAALMLTNPNTCGVFEKQILEICQIVHDKGGKVYLDGANMNAMIGITRPGEMGVDVLHFNTHKTFSTPHGGGGPGAGPIGLSSELEPYLPKPILKRGEKGVHLDYERPLSIGKIRSFYGSIGVLIRAYTYIKTLGNTGLKEMSETAVLNANYLKKRLENHYEIPFNDDPCMHEVLLSDKTLESRGLSTMDIAKGLIDRGFHPPTVYFPLVVKGAILIEPTETESLATLDHFADTLIDLLELTPEKAHELPQKPLINRVDEVMAARNPVLRWLPRES